MEYPIGIAYFLEDFEFSQAIAFCHDNHFDVMDAYINGQNIIIFFNHQSIRGCLRFSRRMHFHVIFYEISTLLQ